MSYNQQPGSSGTREYLQYETARGHAQVQYNYADESGRQNTQAQREPPPAQFPQPDVGQGQYAAPRPPRPLRGFAEYETEVQRAVSRSLNFGRSQNVFTGAEKPFEHLGQCQAAIVLMRTIEAYARQSYPPNSVEMSYVEAFLRQLDQVKLLIGHSWTGADLCAGHDLSGQWGVFLHLFTGYLQGANNLFDSIQILITRCEWAMYDRRGRLRDDANRRFMAAFNTGDERADLTGAMRDWVRTATRVDGDPSSLLDQARDLQRRNERNRERR